MIHHHHGALVPLVRLCHHYCAVVVDHALVYRYLNFVADRLDLRKDIEFNTQVWASLIWPTSSSSRCAAAFSVSLLLRAALPAQVKAASFDEDTSTWDVTVACGKRYRANYVVAAMGCLSTANVPDIKGLDDFQGEWYALTLEPRFQAPDSGKAHLLSTVPRNLG